LTSCDLVGTPPDERLCGAVESDHSVAGEHHRRVSSDAETGSEQLHIRPLVDPGDLMGMFWLAHDM